MGSAYYLSRNFGTLCLWCRFSGFSSRAHSVLAHVALVVPLADELGTVVFRFDLYIGESSVVEQSLYFGNRGRTDDTGRKRIRVSFDRLWKLSSQDHIGYSKSTTGHECAERFDSVTSNIQVHRGTHLSDTRSITRYLEGTLIGYSYILLYSRPYVC